MKKELLLKILSKLDKESILLSKEELGLNIEQYGELVEILTKSRLIEGITVNRVGMEGRFQITSLHPHITVMGIEYLNNNLKNTQYKVEEIGMYDFENVLNEHGEEGWETISIIPNYGSESRKGELPSDGIFFDIQVKSYRVVFKKIKQ